MSRTTKALGLVMTATPEEMRPLASALAGATVRPGGSGDEPEICVGRIDGQRIALAVAGVGKAMGSGSVMSVLHRLIAGGERPSWLVFTGMAGALNPAFSIGDVLVGRDCVQYDLDARPFTAELGQIPGTEYRIFSSAETLVAQARSAGVADQSSQSGLEGALHEGRIITGDKFIADKTETGFAEIARKLSGDAVDMEGAAAALSAHRLGIPFLLLRHISDSADGAKPANFSKLLNKAARNTICILAALKKLPS